MRDEAFTIRPATPEDRDAIGALLNREFYIHRHLDWRPALEWVGRQPFFLLYQGRILQAALACPEDPAGVAWVHLFAASAALTPEAAWQQLFPAALETFQQSTPPRVVAICLQRWFQELLAENQFQHHQDIVVLNWNNRIPPARPAPDGLRIREMRADDLPGVTGIDNLAFEDIWRNSLESVTLAYRQAAWATVAEADGRMLGFQISTATPLTTHLARLAVSPEARRQNVGYALVCDLFRYFERHGSWQLTVNTQSDNSASLALYDALGFERTGDRFPVMRLV